jgi:hypothetical protein
MEMNKMGIKNSNADRDILIRKITYNLVEINQISKLDMANSLIEEVLKNMNETDRLKYESIYKLDTTEKISKEVEKMFRDEMSTFSNKIDALLVTKINFITKITVDYLNKINEQSKQAQLKLNKFHKRSKFKDALILFNLATTPFLLIIILVFLIFNLYV